MFDFFSKILGFVESFFEYFLNLIESLFLALRVLSTATQVPLFLSGYVPSILSSALLIVVALGVVKFIVGR